MNKLLPTSTAGSLPKPSWLAQPEKLWSPWKLQDEELTEGKQDALRLSLQEQQHAGNCHEGGNTRLKGRRSGHDDPHEGQDESKGPYKYAENRDHHPLPHDHQRRSYFLRFSVAAQQQCQAESEQI